MGSQRASPRKGVGNLISQLRGHRRGTGYRVSHVVSWLNWRSPTCCCFNEWPDGYSLHLALHVPCRYFCHTRRLRVWLTVSIWQYSCSKMQCTLRSRGSVSTLVLLQQSRRQCTTRQSLDFLCSVNRRSVHLSLFHCSINEPHCSSIVSYSLSNLLKESLKDNAQFPSPNSPLYPKQHEPKNNPDNNTTNSTTNNINNHAIHNNPPSPPSDRRHQPP